MKVLSVRTSVWNDKGEGRVVRHWLAVLVIAAVGFAAAAFLPARVAIVGTHSAFAKTCHSGYVHVNFTWGERCIRAGQYCKKTKNPQYHKNNFKCVNHKLQKVKKGKKGK